MCFFGSTEVTRQLLQPNFGYCTFCKNKDGIVDLIEDRRIFFVFCCIPTTETKEEIVKCQTCGNAIKSCYYTGQKLFPQAEASVVIEEKHA